MAQVSVASTIHAEQNTCAQNSSNNQGVLKAEGKEHQVFPFADTSSASEGVSDFLQEINQQPAPEALDHEVVVFTPEMLEIEEQIACMQEELTSMQEEVTQNEGSNPKNDPSLKNASDPKLSGKDPNAKILERRASSAENTQSPTAKSTVVHTSLFALARSFNKSLSEARSEKASLQENQGKQESKENSPHSARINQGDETVHDAYTQTKHEKDQEKEHQQRERDQGDEEQQQEDPPKKKQDVKKINTKAVSANISTARPSVNIPKKSMGQASRAEPASGGGGGAAPVLGSVENLFYRFMALMARILGQAEAEAHALYLRIKDRTDSIDQLTLLLSKINAEKGTIDWTKNDEMKQLIDKARAIGVEIPEGKYKWTEDEKKLLKENIQMRKDSMEKVTQLERTDMQRFLQEASQCHQARSNILKLLKEVVDTIIHNFRGN